jgi:hypothetical protein
MSAQANAPKSRLYVEVELDVIISALSAGHRARRG